MWSLNIQVVTEHPHVSPSVQVVTERPCKSLSSHMHHRVSRWSLSIQVVTEHPRASLNVHVVTEIHMCHCRLDRAHRGCTLRLIQWSLGAGGSDAVVHPHFL